MAGENISQRQMECMAQRVLFFRFLFAGMEMPPYEVALSIQHCMVRGLYATKVELEQFDAIVRTTALDLISQKGEGLLLTGFIEPTTNPSKEFVGKVALAIVVTLRVQELLNAEDCDQLWEEVGYQYGVALPDMRHAERSYRSVIRELHGKIGKIWVM